MASSLRIGVIGAGQVGGALGFKLAKKGHKITYGSRDPNSTKIQEFIAKQAPARAETIEKTVAWADVVLLTTPGSADDDGIHKLAASLGPGVAGKVVIDVTNPVTAFPALEVRWGQVKSAGEVLAEALPDSVVFKAFNTVGVEVMLDPVVGGQPATMLYAGAGSDKGAEVVKQIVGDVGFVPQYVGPIRYARNLEAIAELWIHLAIPPAHKGQPPVTFGRQFNFQVVGRS